MNHKNINSVNMQEREYKELTNIKKIVKCDWNE